MEIYSWLVAPLGLGALYVFVPPSEFRTGPAGLVTATVLGLLQIGLFGRKFWLDLRDADAVEEAVREARLNHDWVPGR